MGNCNNIYSIIGIDKHGICLRIPVLLPPPTIVYVMVPMIVI